MDNNTKKMIIDEIIPHLRNGDLTLFLGAGATIGTPAINDLNIPSTQQLIDRICREAGYSPDVSKETDLPTAFGVGEDDIDNFENFLVSNFTTIKPFPWQVDIFKHWWRAIFTTNIDTVPEKCIQIVKSQGSTFPSYQVFNYKDREPVQSLPIEPPLVYLHGKVSSAQEGFVFDNVSYAEHSINQSDWLVKCALHIAHGNCLFVGSKFKESDIETSLRRRKMWDLSGENKGGANNWIVLRDFNDLEERSYRKRGIIPIKAKAEEFFSFIFSQVSPLTKHKFIKKKAPFLSDSTDNKSLAWFTKNMTSVSEDLERGAKRNAPFSLFYNGDMPDWFYIYNKVPAELSAYRELLEIIATFKNSADKAKIVPVLGPLASGKTTISMLALAELCKTNNNVYKFSGLDGVDIEAAWSVLKDLKGFVVIFIDSSSSYYYAVNEIVDRVLDRATACKLCFVLEERTLHYRRNKRHFTKLPVETFQELNVGRLNEKDAAALYDKTKILGINFEKLEGLTRDSAVKKIVDFDNGYNGDLLATLYDLSSRRSYKERLSEEFEEVEEGLARDIYQTISLVTASRLQIPVNYLCEIYSVSIETLIGLVDVKLKDKVQYRGTSMTLSSRHHSIAEYHLIHSFSKEDIKNSILGLMKCVSRKFSIHDIRRHPISYKIYSKIMSYHYLTETIFSGRDQYHMVHDIYSKCQSYFSDDGVFWLQYGRFLERDNEIVEALHCFRKGLALYDSFQLRHALGQLLLKKYRLDKSPFDDEFSEGVEMLQNEIESRGSYDAYPYTALGNELIRIYQSEKKMDECASLLKDVINRGLRIHQGDRFFSRMVAKYFAVVGGAEVH